MLTKIALAGLMLLATVALPTVRSGHAAAAVPDNLAVPRGAMPLFKTYAAGVQTYVCTPEGDYLDKLAFVWTFKGPEAQLWDELGEKIGTHYAGPTWEGNDGSVVAGEVAARADAPNAGAIPWLLLRAKSGHGAGIFSGVSYIQRLDTAGGVAPTDGCDWSSVGAKRAVPYTATYAFYGGAAL